MINTFTWMSKVLLQISLSRGESKILTSIISNWNIPTVCRQETGHFKQMMVGLNSRIGCAITRFSDKNWSYQLLVCLYGCKKKTEQKVFATGKFPGEYCHCGVSSPYKYLCRKSEPSLDCGLIVDHDMDNPNPVDNRGTMETLAKPTHRKSTMPPDFYNQFIRDLRM